MLNLLDFSFKLLINSGKSTKEGVLITHGGHFKFTKNNFSRDGKTHWYTCSQKLSHGCTARAIIKREEFTGDDGELWVKNRLVEIATPEVCLITITLKILQLFCFRPMQSFMFLTTPRSSQTASWSRLSSRSTRKNCLQEAKGRPRNLFFIGILLFL